MTREDPQMKLRLTPEMRDRLKAEADANKRSVNAEIVHRLGESLRAGYPYLSDQEVLQYIGRSSVSAEEVLSKMSNEVKNHHDRLSVLIMLLHRIQKTSEPDSLEDCPAQKVEPSPYELGRRAFQPNGGRKPKNPFSTNPEKADQWEQGYDAESRMGTMNEED